MRLYVTGRWAKRDQIAEIIEKLEAWRHAITQNWTQTDVDEEQMDDDCSRTHAMLSIGAIQAAEALVVIWDEGGRGMWVAMGVALGNGIPVFIVGSEDRKLFEQHPLITHLDDIEYFRPRSRSTSPPPFRLRRIK